MNSKISLLAHAFEMLSAQSNEHYSSYSTVKEPTPDWKRKKCKSCKMLGSKCKPYLYKTNILYRYSKPNYSACNKYQKK